MRKNGEEERRKEDENREVLRTCNVGHEAYHAEVLSSLQVPGDEEHMRCLWRSLLTQRQRERSKDGGQSGHKACCPFLDSLSCNAVPSTSLSFLHLIFLLALIWLYWSTLSLTLSCCILILFISLFFFFFLIDLLALLYLISLLLLLISFPFLHFYIFDLVLYLSFSSHSRPFYITVIRILLITFFFISFPFLFLPS